MAVKLLVAAFTGALTLERSTSLNWSPEDVRLHAYQWQDPDKGNAGVNVVVNALAYVGLGLLPVAPTTRGPEAVGFPGRAGLLWPIWDCPIGVAVVGSLLAESSSWLREAELGTPGPRSARGVLATFFSARVNPSGQRNFLAPARPV